VAALCKDFVHAANYKERTHVEQEFPEILGQMFALDGGFLKLLLLLFYYVPLDEQELLHLHFVPVK